MTLRVTLEIVPFGDEDRKYKIGQLDIFNKGRVDMHHYQYGIIQLDPKANTGGMYKIDIIHCREDGAWELVQKVLQCAVNNYDRQE